MEGAAEVPARIFLIALGIFLPRLRDAARRVEKALPIRIVARPTDERSDRVADIAWDLQFRRGLDEIAVLGFSARLEDTRATTASRTPSSTSSSPTTSPNPHGAQA